MSVTNTPTFLDRSALANNPSSSGASVPLPPTPALVQNPTSASPSKTATPPARSSAASVLPPALASTSKTGAPLKRSSAPPSPTPVLASALVQPSYGKRNIEEGRVAELIRAAEKTDLVLQNGERDIGAWKKQDPCEAERGRVAVRASSARKLNKTNRLKKNRESHSKAVDPSFASLSPSSASRSAPLSSPSKKTVAPGPKRSSARIVAAKHKIQKHTQKKFPAMEVPSTGYMLGKIWGELEEIIEYVPDATAGGLEETIEFFKDN